jgi:hypothetical protein
LAAIAFETIQSKNSFHLIFLFINYPGNLVKWELVFWAVKLSRKSLYILPKPYYTRFTYDMAIGLKLYLIAFAKVKIVVIGENKKRIQLSLMKNFFFRYPTTNC